MQPHCLKRTSKIPRLTSASGTEPDAQKIYDERPRTIQLRRSDLKREGPLRAKWRPSTADLN